MSFRQTMSSVCISSTFLRYKLSFLKPFSLTEKEPCNESISISHSSKFPDSFNMSYPLPPFQLLPRPGTFPLAYKDPKGDQTSNVIEDIFGNDLNSFSGYGVEIVKI